MKYCHVDIFKNLSKKTLLKNNFTLVKWLQLQMFMRPNIEESSIHKSSSDSSDFIHIYINGPVSSQRRIHILFL